MTNVPSDFQAPKKAKKTKKVLLIILCVLLALLLLLTGTFFALREIGRHRLLKDNTAASVPEELVDLVDEIGTEIIYNGQKYDRNENIVSILLMGVDKDSIQDNKNYGSNGQADVLIATTIDTKTGKICMIPLSRESMVEVDVYSLEGTKGKTEIQQICLAYAYGRTGEESCANVMRSAGRMLCGIEFDSYVAMDIEGIKALTKVVGGIEVVSIESFGEGTSAVKEGEKLLLTEKNVDQYIRSRKYDVNANNRRMQRQKQFMNAFINKAGNMVVKDFKKLTAFYNAAKPYTVSDLGLPEITYLASCMLTTNIGNSIEYISIEGEMREGAEYTEFYPDVNSLFEAVLRAYYVPAE